jgi:hypothetical protein
MGRNDRGRHERAKDQHTLLTIQSWRTRMARNGRLAPATPPRLRTPSPKPSSPGKSNFETANGIRQKLDLVPPEAALPALRTPDSLPT